MQEVGWILVIGGPLHLAYVEARGSIYSSRGEAFQRSPEALTSEIAGDMYHYVVVRDGERAFYVPKDNDDLRTAISEAQRDGSPLFLRILSAEARRRHRLQKG